MKICVVIQSEAFRSSAGVRIRYDRFSEALVGSGTTIDTIPYRDLMNAKSLDHDVYVFCKTFETAALLLARRISAAGKAVGQDLFDDYFSQYSDPRLARFREWMRDMAPVTDFAICSTEAMVQVIRPYLPGVPIVAIEDPVVHFNPEAVGDLAQAKARQARLTRTLDVVWFGIGDNPFFPVGLADLATCDPQLAVMERLGWDVRLRIITNRRPFEAAGAEILRRLSVGYELIEWTEEAEEEALTEATVALIPVKGQPFSRAKSMNRAVTALNRGCQVLSLGYPLYEKLDQFIYRRADDLVRDLAESSPRLRPDTMPALAERLLEVADPVMTASTFADEARKAQAASAARKRAPSLTCLIHGRNSTIDLHKLVSAQGGLSVASMFATPEWNFDVRFDRAGREIVMRVTTRLAGRFDLPVRQPAEITKIHQLEFVQVDLQALGVRQLFIDLPPKSGPITELAIYEDVMRFAQECCLAAFPGADLLISDSSNLTRRPVGIPAKTAPRRRAAYRAPEDRAAGSRGELQLPRAERGDGLRAVAGLDGIFRRRRKKGDRKKALALLAQSPLFDRQWYLERYPDVAEGGMDPAVHYLEHGWQEGRNPSAAFSTRKYLRAYKDVAAQNINPLLHFIEHGQWEGRKAFPVLKGAVPA